MGVYVNMDNILRRYPRLYITYTWTIFLAVIPGFKNIPALTASCLIYPALRNSS